MKVYRGENLNRFLLFLIFMHEGKPLADYNTHFLLHTISVAYLCGF